MNFKYLILAVAMSSLLSACDQLRSDMADLISPPSETQVAARMVDLLNAGKSSEAIAMGEKYLSKSRSEGLSVHAKLAELYLEQGDAGSALKHLEQSTPASTHQSSGATHSTTEEIVKIPAPQPPNSPEATARIGPDGVEARAGNARASVKP